MTAPGGVIATVYVQVLPEVRRFADQLRRDLRASSRELRTIDRELSPVVRGFEQIARAATGIVPGVRLARTSLLALGGHAILGGLLSAAGAATTLSGALAAVPAAGAGAASVLGALTVGLFGVDDALKKFAVEEKFNAKLELLSTNAQKTLGVINELRAELTTFRDIVQDRLFEGLDQVARDLATTFLPILTTHFSNLVGTINGGVRDLAAFVQTAETLNDVNAVTSNTESAFQLLRQALVPAATALRDVVTVGSRFLPEIALEVQRVVVRFSEWIQVMRATGQLETFIRNGIDALKQIFRIVGNVGRAFNALFTAAQESGNGFLDTLERLTDSLADFLESVRGQELIGSFLDSASAAASALAPVLLALVDLLITDVFPILEDFATTVGPAVAQFFSGLGDALDVAAPGIHAFASGFASFLRAITPVLPLLGQLLGQLGALFGALAGQVGPALANVATAIGNVLLPILQIMTTVIQALPEGFFQFAIVIGVVTVAVAGLITVVRGIQAVVGLFAGFTSTLTKGLQGTQGAATGLVGFLSGPWGIAIGLATTALGLFLSTTDDTAQSQTAAKNAAASLNDVIREQNGIINDNVRSKASQILEDEGVLDLARQTGITLADVTDAYLNQGASLDDLRGQLNAIIRANTTWVASGRTTTQVVAGQGVAAQELLDKLNALVGGREAEAASQDRQTDATIRGISPMTAFTLATEQARLAILGLVDAQERSRQQQLESLNSEIAYFNQLERTNTELADGAKTLDIHSQEGRDNLAVITQLVQAGLARVADLREQGVGTQELIAITQQMQDELINMIAPFFSSRDAARQYLETLGLIPSSITTSINLDISRVLSAAQTAANVIRNIPNALFGIGGRAHGGPTQPGEWAVVGEEGPELVRFGRTARVFSNDESERMIEDVGALDDMTARGGTRGTRVAGSGVGSAIGPITVDNQITVDPNVHVYVDGQELRGVVRVELDSRDRQLRRLVTTNVGRW